MNCIDLYFGSLHLYSGCLLYITLLKITGHRILSNRVPPDSPRPNPQISNANPIDYDHLGGGSKSKCVLPTLGLRVVGAGHITFAVVGVGGESHYLR